MAQKTLQAPDGWRIVSITFDHRASLYRIILEIKSCGTANEPSWLAEVLLTIEEATSGNPVALFTERCKEATGWIERLLAQAFASSEGESDADV